MATFTDDKDNILHVGDKVVFVCWGYNVSLSMTQGTHTIVGFGRTRAKVELSHMDKTVSVRTIMLRKVS